MALICVKHIIEQWETYLGDGRGELNPNLRFWKEVKIEMVNKILHWFYQGCYYDALNSYGAQSVVTRYFRRKMNKYGK